MNHHRALFLVTLVAGCHCSACSVALGPGYTIEKQQIDVQFVPAPEPQLRLNAVYQLRNTGNQPLAALELRLPGRQRFRFVDPRARWDRQEVRLDPSPTNPRNNVLLFPKLWAVSTAHSLHLSVVYEPPEGEGETLSFSTDAFFLPAQGWSPELLPARGLLATGGSPPKNWDLFVRVPDGFLVHPSGRIKGRKLHSGEQIIHAVQQPGDGYPFLIAGKFKATQFHAADEIFNLWTRSPQNVNALREPGAALTRAIRAYESMFGVRPQGANQFWFVECPALRGCFTATTSNYAKLISGENTRATAEMASADTVMLDLSAGVPQIAAEAAPSLAASWLGYGENPGYFEQVPPLSALPAFAAFRAREAVEGTSARAQTIRRLLQEVPAVSTPGADEDTVLRAKSVLFFYGLQDHYGEKAFGSALRHILEARRGTTFDLDDLISALEQEAHQNAAEFVRLWMKHPGVPADFRARYESPSARLLNSKETP
jgi:hypothetical protein